MIVALLGGTAAGHYLLGSNAAGVKTQALARTQANVLVFVNQQRRARGLHELRLDPALARVATRHTERMIEAGFFAHDDPNGSTFARRVKPLRRRLAGETLAWGTGNWAQARGIVALWMASPPHRRVLLTPRMRRIGVAVLRGGPYRGQSSAVVTTADLST